MLTPAAGFAPRHLDRVGHRTYISLRCVSPIGAAVRSPCRHCCWVPERSPIGGGSGTPAGLRNGAIVKVRCRGASHALPGQVDLLGSRTSVIGGRDSTLSAGEPTMGKSVSKLRSRAHQSQGGRCFYCSVMMWTDDCIDFANRHGLTPSLARWLQCTAEHLHPRQEGGRDSAENIAAACRYCNLRRHARRRKTPTPEEYRSFVRNRVSRKAWHQPQIFDQGLIQL